jgi:hypothetical protein
VSADTKPQTPLGVLTDTHAGGPHDAAGGIGCPPRQPEGGTGVTEVTAVPFGTNSERSCKTAGTPREITVADAGSAAAHEFESEDRFERAQKDPCSHPLRAGGDIDQEMKAVAPVDVGVTAFQEK